MNPMNFTFYYWGPFLYHTQMYDQDINQIKKLCNKKAKNDTRHTLVGHIKEEYTIDKNVMKKIMVPYVNSYFQAEETHHNFIRKPKKWNITSVWVNYMKAGEFNPIHNHADGGELSFVLYPSIPQSLIDEANKIVSTCNSKPGQIEFSWGEYSDQFISNIRFFPIEKDIFIFPSKLRHMVFPFNSNGERVSVAGNIRFVY
jgi:hypothetical protein